MLSALASPTHKQLIAFESIPLFKQRLVTGAVLRDEPFSLACSMVSCRSSEIGKYQG